MSARAWRLVAILAASCNVGIPAPDGGSPTTPTSVVAPEPPAPVATPAPCPTVAPAPTESTAPLGPPDPERVSTCLGAYTQAVKLGCPPPAGHGWLDVCPSISKTAVACVKAAKDCVHTRACGAF